MKNTLVRYLDFEINDEDPQLNIFTQRPVVVTDFEADPSQYMDMSVFTADTAQGSHVNREPTKCDSKENLNIFVFHDDSSFINFTVGTLRKKGVKIVDLPRYYDLQSLIPFLLLNDHSILLVTNPKKDVLPLLKSIIRTGVIWYKPPGGAIAARPIRINLTIWIFVDVVPWLEKLAKSNKGLKPNQPPKNINEISEKEYGDRGELMQLFDVVVDISQYTNLGIMGSKYLKYQEGYVLESLAAHLEGNDKLLSTGIVGKKGSLLYDYRGLKCACHESLLKNK